MQSFFQTLVSGLSFGAVYALVALGFSLVYRTMGLVNFAHGAVLMIGAYVASTFYLSARLPFAVAVPAAMVVTGAVGLVIERVLRPLENKDFDLMLIGTIGAGTVLEAAAILIWSSAGRGRPVPGPDRAADPRRRPDPALRPAGDRGHRGGHGGADPVPAAHQAGRRHAGGRHGPRGGHRGRHPRRAAATRSPSPSARRWPRWPAALVGPMLYVSPTMGDSLGIQGFAAAILGGFGSIPGAIVGGLGIGVIGSFAAQSVPGLLRPGHVRGVHRAGDDPADRDLRREDGEPGVSARWRRRRALRGRWSLLAVVAWLLPYRLNVYWISVADTALLFALLAIGMGLVMGIAGQVNLAQIAFFGVGAYVTAILTTHDGLRLLDRRPCWPWLATVVTGLVVGHAGAADPVALPGHRHARPGRRVRRLDHQRAGHRRRLGHLRDPGAAAVRHRPVQPVPVLLPGACRAGRRAGVRAVRGAHAAGPADAGDAGRRAGRRRLGRRDRRAADDRLRAGQRVRRRRRGAVRRARSTTSRRRRSASPTCSCCWPWSSSAAGSRWPAA